MFPKLSKHHFKIHPQYWSLKSRVKPRFDASKQRCFDASKQRRFNGDIFITVISKRKHNTVGIRVMDLQFLDVSAYRTFTCLKQWGPVY